MTANKLIAQLSGRLAQDRLSDAKFTEASAEILAASTDKLSSADALLLSQEIRAIEEDWQDSLQKPVN